MGADLAYKDQVNIYCLIPIFASCKLHLPLSPSLIIYPTRNPVQFLDSPLNFGPPHVTVGYFDHFFHRIDDIQMNQRWRLQCELWCKPSVIVMSYHVEGDDRTEIILPKPIISTLLQLDMSTN